MDSTTDTPKLTDTERRELYKKAFELLDKMNQLLDDAFLKHASAHVKQLLEKIGEPDNDFLHVKQVMPSIDLNSTEHKMFDIADDIYYKLRTAYDIVTMAADCGYNASFVDRSHPEDSRLDGNAIHNTLYLALQAIERAKRQLEEYRHLSRKPAKSKPQVPLAETLRQLSKDNLIKLASAIETALPERNT